MSKPRRCPFCQASLSANYDGGRCPYCLGPLPQNHGKKTRPNSIEDMVLLRPKRRKRNGGGPGPKKLMEVWELDQGICWLCNKLVPKPGDIDPHNDYAPSTDHVVAFKDGGTLDVKNLRLAHRLCNNVRHNGDKHARRALNSNSQDLPEGQTG